MLQKTLMAMALASSVFVVGCGGSSSGSSGGSGGGGGTTTDARTDVAGPLDAVQDPVSSQVVTQLVTAAAGTPLEPVVQCVDALVVNDTIDVLDVIAVGLQDGAETMDFQNALTGTAADVQAQLGDVVTNLQGLLAALAGTGGCDGLGTGFSADVLDGTPLEPLGDALAPVLAQIEAATGGGSTLGLGDLAGLYSLLAQSLNSGLSMLPQEAQDAPVLGPALTLVATAVEDVGFTLADATAAATSGDPADTLASIADTLDHLLTGLLLDVVPITTLETEAGQVGVLSGPISDAIDQLAAAIAGGSPDLGDAGLPAEITDVLSLLTDPGTGTDPTGLLTGLLTELQAALDGGSTGGTLPDIGSAELNEAIAQITTLLATAGDTGTPLDDLVDSVAGILDGLLGLIP